MRFHHIGIATEDAETTATLYEALFDCEIVHRETFDGMVIVFLALENGLFELLEPRADGPIETYLERNGPGIHHIAVETADIEAALAGARELGIECLDDEPRPGAWGHEVAFLHPRDTGGVLLEFVEQ